MGTSFNNIPLKKMSLDGQKVKKWIHDGVKVWSGATLVSYYDGETLIGTEEVDEELDVLHPSIDMTKSGYTHVGWKYNGERVTSLTAIGEAMTIEAVYVPNTLTVASGSFGGWNYQGSEFFNYNYSLSVWNTDYISGGSSAYARGKWTSFSGSATFTLNLGDYQNAVGNFDRSGAKYGGTWSVGGGSFTIDGSGGLSGVSLGNGSHTIRVADSAGADAISIAMWINNIVLSNPKAWV